MRIRYTKVKTKVKVEPAENEDVDGLLQTEETRPQEWNNYLKSVMWRIRYTSHSGLHIKSTRKNERGSDNIQVTNKQLFPNKRGETPNTTRNLF